MSGFRAIAVCLCLWSTACTGEVEDTTATTTTSTTTSPTTSTTQTTETGTTATSTTQTTDTTEPDPFPLLPALPLRTEGRFIVDDMGYRFKLASVNWYGFEELDYVPAGLEIAHIEDTAAIIAEMGFNSVRLPFSLEMVTLNPIVSDKVVAANPELFGKRALDVMDAIIDALARHGVVTILDNHSSEAVWYSLTHGLWYTNDYPESVWISVWVELATRYRDHPGVVGYDLRNELRGGATWGGSAATDWKAAASRAADAIFAVDTKPLIVVEGVNYAADLTGPYYDPLILSVPNRLVYSSHDYSWFHSQIYSYDQLASDLGSTWGFIIVEDQPFTAPVWVGEFGTCNTSIECIGGPSYEGAWFSNFLAYLDAGDYDWAYWPVNGTMARADDREYGAVDWFGVLDETWSAPALPELLEALQAIQDPWVGPEYHSND